MLKQSFLTIIALLIALLLSNFEPTNSSPVRILNRIRNGLCLGLNQHVNQHGNQHTNVNRDATGNGNHIVNGDGLVPENTQPCVQTPIQSETLPIQPETQPEILSLPIQPEIKTIEPEIPSIETATLSRQSSIDPNLCSICSDNKISDICYFNCKTSADHPKGHLFCDDCVLNVDRTTHNCPMCRATKDKPKIDELAIKKLQKQWARQLGLIKVLGIILPDEFNPIGVIIPADITPGDITFIVNEFFGLVGLGISFQNNVTIQNKIRNAIHAIHAIQPITLGKEKFIGICIKLCIRESNEIILSDIFEKLVQPNQHRDMILFAIQHSYLLHSSLIKKIVLEISKERNYALSICGKYARTHDDYSKLFKMIRIVYPDSKDEDYKAQMHEILTECRIDVTDILTVEEKHQFNYRFTPHSHSHSDSE